MRVGLFVSCLINSLRPSIGIATWRLLQSTGVDISIPKEQTCCGQPAYNSGYFDQAKKFAERTLSQFAHYDYIVVPSGSCAGMLSHHYPQLLSHSSTQDNQASHSLDDFSSKVVELTTFLNDIVQWHPTKSNTFNKTVTYHDSCAGLRELSVKSQPRQLLKACGIPLKEMHKCQECCGFGGTFSIKYADISTRMADNKLHHAIHTQADILAMGDLGCMLNIEGRLTRLQNGKKINTTIQVMHIAEVLAKAEGLID